MSRSRHAGIAVRVEQALLGGEAGALPVDVDRTALEHEGGAIAVHALDLEHLSGHLVVAVPGKIQAAVETAPGVEGPVDAPAPAPAVDQKVGPQSRIQASLLEISTTRTPEGSRARAFWYCAAETPTVTGSDAPIAAAIAANAA